MGRHTSLNLLWTVNNTWAEQWWPPHRTQTAAYTATLQAPVLLLQKCVRVLQLAVAVLAKYVTAGALVQGCMATWMRPLLHLGAGVGLSLMAHPYFTRQDAMLVGWLTVMGYRSSAPPVFCRRKVHTRAGEGAQENQPLQCNRQGQGNATPRNA